MAGNKMGESTKEKILQAAKLEFLEKGFEPARVDDIASRAGITKAMLYYHFNTKENIFNEMVNKTIAEIREEMRTVLSAVDPDHPESFRGQLESMIFYYERQQTMINMILARQFGSMEQGGVSYLALFKEVFEVITGLVGEAPQRDQEAFLIRVFFFNALPMLFYASFSEQFCSDFGISQEKCRHVFTETFMQSFINAADLSR